MIQRYLPFFCLLLSSLVGEEYIRSNGLYMGPEMMTLRFHTKVQDVTVEGKKRTVGVRMGYEHLHSKDVYAAVSITLAKFDRNFTFHRNNAEYQSGASAGVGAFSYRFGFTLPTNAVLVSPFIGYGHFAVLRHQEKEWKQSIGHIGGGLRISTPQDWKYQAGLLVEWMHHFVVKESVLIGAEKIGTSKKDRGIRFELPLTIRPSPKFQLQGTPYFSRLLFTGGQKVYGGSFIAKFTF